MSIREQKRGDGSSNFVNEEGMLVFRMGQKGKRNFNQRGALENNLSTNSNIYFRLNGKSMMYKHNPAQIRRKFKKAFEWK